MKKGRLHTAMRRTALSAAIALSGLPAMAEHIGPEQALARITAYRQYSPQRQIPGLTDRNRSLRLVHTGRKMPASQTPAYYVFAPDGKAGSGYVIASADDRLRPVLGVADSGEFVEAELPTQLRWWLSEYEAEIDRFLKSTTAVAAETDGTGKTLHEYYAEWEPIAPLVQTRWNQDSPYNNLCPAYNGEKCATGCVATAMAQVIKAIGFAKGQGKNSYTSSKIGQTATYDFENATFDFDKMPDEFHFINQGGNWGYLESQEQQNEVANLMLACGVAVNMDYNIPSRGGSGAGHPINGLVKYLGYDASSTMLSRGSYQSAEWESLIYEQLKAGRPIYYTGSGTGGHAFVCDGYSSDGYFHINWGWGGLSDGYFVLSALMPSSQGIGSFDGGYNMGQAIGIFVRPDSPDKPVFRPSTASDYDVTYQGSLSAPTSSGYVDTFSFMHTLLKSPDGGPATVGVSLLLENTDNTSPDVFIKPMSYQSISIRQTLWNFSVNFANADIPAGTYRAYPAYSIQGTDGYWKVSQFTSNINDHFLLTIDGTGKRTYVPEATINPDVELFNLTTNELYINDALNQVNCIVTNLTDKDFNESISLQLEKPSGEKVMTISNSYMFVRAGESVPLAVNFNTKGISAGDYVIKMYRNKFNTQLGKNSFTVNIKTGSRPETSKGPGPSGMCEIALWANGTGERLPALNITAGSSFSATTALQSYMAQTLDYSIAFFPRGTLYGAIRKYKIATHQFTSATNWIEGDSFTVTPDLPPGVYTIAFVDSNTETLLSFPADCNIVIEHDGVAYRINEDQKTVSAYELTDRTAERYSIPESIPAGKTYYEVSGIGNALFAGHRTVTDITLPATLQSVGLDSFKGTIALNTVFFRSDAVPFENSALAFYGTKPSMACYVNADSYAAYAKAFGSVGSLYAAITGFSAPAEAETREGEEVQVTLDIVPAAHFNPDFDIVIADAGIAAAKTEGATLKITGLAAGKTTITLTSAQPGVSPVKIEVNVLKNDATGIQATGTGQPRTEYFDLSGRPMRVPNGICIQRVHNIDGTVTSKVLH